jgi:hypothetical protein
LVTARHFPYERLKPYRCRAYFRGSLCLCCFAVGPHSNNPHPEPLDGQQQDWSLETQGPNRTSASFILLLAVDADAAAIKERHHGECFDSQCLNFLSLFSFSPFCVTYPCCTTPALPSSTGSTLLPCLGHPTDVLRGRLTLAIDKVHTLDCGTWLTGTCEAFQGARGLISLNLTSEAW